MLKSLILLFVHLISLCCPVFFQARPIESLNHTSITSPTYPHHARYIPACRHRDIPKRDGHIRPYVRTYAHDENRSRIRKLATLATSAMQSINGASLKEHWATQRNQAYKQQYQLLQHVRP